VLSLIFIYLLNGSSNPVKFLCMPVTREHIDHLNAEAYRQRYASAGETVSLGRKALDAALKTGYEQGIAFARLNLAISAFLHSENQQAFTDAAAAREYFARHPADRGYPVVLNLLGNLLESLGDYEKGLEYCLQAYKLAGEGVDEETRAETAGTLGLIYSRLCDLDKALHYYQESMEIRSRMGDEPGMASSLNRIAMIHRQGKNYEEALKYYFQSLAIREDRNLLSAIPWTYLGIANTYEEMGKFIEALEYYHRIGEHADKRCQCQCNLGAGRASFQLGDHEKAEQLLRRALNMARELQARPLISEVWMALARLHESEGNLDLALDAYKKHQHEKEAVLNEESRLRMQRMEIAHAVEKSEQEKEIFRLRHVELKEAYDQIEEKNREITSSIAYAKRIQNALLPECSEIPWLTEHSFILYLPRDIVSGDFYWFTEFDGTIFFAAADSTGHGVPGAFMSMLGISFLDEIVNRREILEPAAILDALRSEVVRSLHQTGKDEESKDGMDIALVAIYPDKRKVSYAGAYNSAYLLHEGSLTEVPADHMPIGIHRVMDLPFGQHEFQAEAGDVLYLFSDGLADQFGGPKGKKFKYQQLQELFVEVHTMPLEEQRNLIGKRFTEWKGSLDQVDDILVVGIRF
jgi:serine phosphatase RsbU (regulator of sigma subunit)